MVVTDQRETLRTVTNTHREDSEGLALVSSIISSIGKGFNLDFTCISLIKGAELYFFCELLFHVLSLFTTELGIIFNNL